MDKGNVVQALKEMGLILELLGENPFKTRAYSNAARALDKDPRTATELVNTGELGKLKGVGKAIVEKVTTLVETGQSPYLEELRAKIPEGLGEVLRVPGLGPKKVRTLWKELEIESLAELEYACVENRLLLLKGFGEKSQAKALEGIRFLKANRGRRLLADVLDIAAEVLEATKSLPGVERIEQAGSLRRRSPVVKDIDLVVSSPNGESVSQAIAALGGVQEVIMQGPSRTSVIWEGGVQVDWKIVEPQDFPAALLHFTGSKEHNVHLRQRAKERGFSLSEYGLKTKDGEAFVPSSETELYAKLDLAFIPPERREDLGEIEAASQGELPPMVCPEDLKGAIHLHTNRSDGATDLRSMALAAKALGFEYLGVSDHSKTAVYAGGLTAEQLLEQKDEVEALNAENLGIRILHGIESDILPDGSLDYPHEILAQLDFVIGSVHSSFQLSEAEMTARILKAMDNPFLDFLGHPTGRILLGRKPYALDMSAVLHKAAETGVVLEVNASPSRLDLDYSLLPLAKELGVKVAINPDAHSPGGLSDTEWGIHTARKGGLQATDVINTLPAEEFLKALRRDRA